MREMSSSAWQRRGSSVVYHRHMLGPLIAAGCLMSLREALGWLHNWPDAPPGNGQTVLVGGLETSLEVLSPAEAEDFLRRRVQPFISVLQSRWDQRGLVFGFGCPSQRFRINTHEEVLFSHPQGGVVRLSSSLWNGAAGQDMYRLFTKDPATNQLVPGGFHVRRLS
jgi:hypothetical protein